MLETMIEHGCYGARVRLYSKPVGDMAGLISINDSKMEINLKLTREDLENIFDQLDEYFATHPSPH